MELRHAAMVNWHLFDMENIRIAGHVGILGENRSGKSTILDMIQVVLTGASKSYLRLNAVAGDGTKGRFSGSRRSVHSYCLGVLGDGDVRRQDALTYIALGFEDPRGDRPPVSIGLAMAARKSEAVEDIYGRFVVVGKILTTEDFTEITKEGAFPATWDAVKARISAEVGTANFINHRDKAIDYVREYMRRLVPTLPTAEQNATAMLKAIVNAMTLNHGLSATEFVRRFILEENPIRIGELRSSIETYKGVSATIVTMRKKLEALKKIGVTLTGFEESLDRKALEDWLAKRARWLASRCANRAIKAKIAEAQMHIAAESDDLDDVRQTIGEINADITRLTNAIAAHQAKTGRDSLDVSLKLLHSQGERNRTIMDRRKADARIIGQLPNILPDAGPEEIIVILAYQRLATSLDLTADTTSVRKAETELRLIAPKLLERIAMARRTGSAQADALSKEIEVLRGKLDQTRQMGTAAYLENGTKLLMRRLESAGMLARPLCDIVEITVPEWVPAAEALIGRDREAIFVECHNIHEATQIFKGGRREFQRASLVSLNKLEFFRERPKPGLFPSIFRTEDPDAMAFLQRRYGSVRLAETLERFNEPGRALMKDGLYDDGLVRSHRYVNPNEHKIGKAAQTAMIAGMKERLGRIGENYAEADALEKSLGRAAAALETLIEGGQLLVDLVDEMVQVSRGKSDMESRIAAIDAEGDGGLRDRLKAQRDFLQRKEAERQVIRERNDKYQREIAIGEHDLGKSDSAEGSEMNLKLVKRLYARERELYRYLAGSAVYRERLAKRHDDTMIDSSTAVTLTRAAGAHGGICKAAEENSDKARNRMHEYELRARGELREFFNQFGTSAQIGPDSVLLREVKPWIQVLIEDLEGNEIRRYENKAREAAERASTLFRSEFVIALNQRVAKMERDIEQLNRNLRDHPFHNERYSFHRTAEAEFQPILKIVEISRISDDALDMLFRPDVPEDFPHKDTIKAVEQLLEDPAKDFTAFEDYRNFHTFEIHMEDIETRKKTRWEMRRGTGSGAEQQVPLYVAIGASLASVYGSAGQTPGRAKSMAPALFDEAFSKMDGKNQRQMMSFYEKLGLQVVIAAPMEKKGAIMGYMETIVEIDRIGEQSVATVVRLKQKARDEILAMNPEHMTDAEIAERMAAE